MNKMLAPYRVLDLTDEESMACGKILADMGADVIQMEKVGGALARHRSLCTLQSSRYSGCRYGNDNVGHR